MTDSMEIDAPPVPPTAEQEDDSLFLAEMLEKAEDTCVADAERIATLTAIVTDNTTFSVGAVRIKESACFQICRLFCSTSSYKSILPFLTETCTTLFDGITKAKVAKIVRQILDVVSSCAPEELEMLNDVCTGEC
jgi:hypothetical protein